MSLGLALYVSDHPRGHPRCRWSQRRQLGAPCSGRSSGRSAAHQLSAAGTVVALHLHSSVSEPLGAARAEGLPTSFCRKGKVSHGESRLLRTQPFSGPEARAENAPFTPSQRAFSPLNTGFETCRRCLQTSWGMACTQNVFTRCGLVVKALVLEILHHTNTHLSPAPLPSSCSCHLARVMQDMFCVITYVKCTCKRAWFWFYI